MDNPTLPELSNTTSPPALAPPQALDPPEAVSPSTTLGLALHPVPAQEIAPASAPHPDPTRNPAPIPDPTPLPAPPASTTPRLPEHFMCKNRLQEYTQRASLRLPVYQTFNEGSSHAPRFRSTVWVDGAQYTSPNTFSHRKAAEQDVAKLALESILKRVKDEGCPLLQEDTVFCKSILNEFAVKMNLKMPTYNTVQPPGLLPVFVSTLVFNGVSYTGNTGRNKKEAEQLAARTVILSLLGTLSLVLQMFCISLLCISCVLLTNSNCETDDSGSSKILYEIIKSKSKLYAALDRVKDPSHSQPNIVPMGVKVESCSETTVRQEQEVRTAIVRDAASVSASSPAASGVHPPHHELKRSRTDSASEPIPVPIAFVHPVSEQPLDIDVGSSSAKKRRKNKKKASKNVNTDAQ
ncbi:unnamed protein product [Dovyalis caffra]|uniref:DRBM domain-containing protein n=1 Tax=Dovyalis caffra TaxID=77055 RepID=A0AAV1RTJ5_9ROSI|nr:unnamed protein product [Dovyalis caffra]